MAVKQSATFTGTENNEARPGAFSAATSIDTLAGDIAYAYERLTGLPVHSSVAVAAAGHRHDGTAGGGALLNIPLAQGHLGADLDRNDAVMDPTTVDKGYQPILYFPFFAPAGCTTVRWVGWTSIPDTANSVVGQTFSQTLVANGLQVTARTDDAAHFADRGSGFIPMTIDLPVNAGQINVIQVSAYDAANYPAGGRLPQNRNIASWALFPANLRPNPTPSTSLPAQTGTDVVIPTAFQHFDTSMLASPRSLNAFLTSWITRNIGLIYEVATGLAADSLEWRATSPGPHDNRTRYFGHNHEDDGATSLDQCGLDIDQPLGAWAYGVGRRKPAETPVGGDRLTHQNGNQLWLGRMHMPCIRGSAGGGVFVPIAFHRFRMPAATAAHVAGGSGRIKAAFLVRTKQGNTNGEVDGEIFAKGDTGSTSSVNAVSAAVTPAADTDHLLTLAGLQAEATEDVQTFRTRMAMNPARGGEWGVYGCCLYYERS